MEGLTWGVAGRDEEKLKKTCKEIGEKANKDLSSLPIIIADVRDEKSLQKMAERAKVNSISKYFGDVIVYLRWNFNESAVCLGYRQLLWPLQTVWWASC